MQYRSFGNTDLTVSLLGFGCQRIAALSRDRQDVERAIYTALDSGVNFFDTADSYNEGHSEQLLGKLLRNQRQQIIICTKAGHYQGICQAVIRQTKPYLQSILRTSTFAHKSAVSAATRFSGKQNFDPKYIVKSIKRSLRRLETDYIDLFYLHNPSSESLSDDLFGALDDMKERGHIRYYGVSCSSREALHASDEYALKIVRLSLSQSGVSAIQVPISLMRRTFLPIAREASEKNKALVAREPFDSGKFFICEYFKDQALSHPYLTPAQVALKFPAQLPDISVVLTGMTKFPHVEENVAAINAEPLDELQMGRLEAFEASKSIALGRRR